MTHLSWLLMWFKALSRLIIKLDKIELIPIGRVIYVDILATELGCKMSKLPYIYLGLPLGASCGSEAVWDFVEEKVHRKLSLWKRQHISKRGDLL